MEKPIRKQALFVKLVALAGAASAFVVPDGSNYSLSGVKCAQMRLFLRESEHVCVLRVEPLQLQVKITSLGEKCPLSLEAVK